MLENTQLSGKQKGQRQDFHILLLRDKVDRVGLWPTALRLTIAVEQGFPSAYISVDRCELSFYSSGA